MERAHLGHSNVKRKSSQKQARAIQAQIRLLALKQNNLAGI